MTQIRFFICAVLILFSLAPLAIQFVGAHEGEEDASNAVGPDKGILAADVHDGIRLAPGAIRTLGLRWQSISTVSRHRLPLNAIVHFQAEVAVYRYRDGWFKLIEVEELKHATGEVMFSTSELKEGDEVVVEGVPLLRVAELSALGGSEEGHGD